MSENKSEKCVLFLNELDVGVQRCQLHSQRPNLLAKLPYPIIIEGLLGSLFPLPSFHLLPQPARITFE